MVQNIEEKKARQKELTELLREAARAYEQEDREIISNFEYDRLYDELQKLEQETGIIMADSPTIKVGYEILSNLPKDRHESPMLSLDKTKDREELATWLGNRNGVLSWKMDGLTIVLTYENGELIKAVTRGNGEVGEIVTNNARVFKNVPLTIPCKERLVVRGEAVIRYSDFERLNSTIEDVSARYKNPRNLCSGSVRQLNNEITAQRNVYLYVYALIKPEGGSDNNSDSDMKTDNSISINKEYGSNGFMLRSEQLAWLESLGFDVVERRVVSASTVVSAVAEFEAEIGNNAFPSDGLVLIYDEIAYGQSLGKTAKFPRDAIAFKWADEIRETVLREVEWSASRTGLINPVAIFNPVELEGTTVSRASLHNISIMEELSLGIGDTVTVYKANMIIPQIADNLTRSGMMDLPEFCPVCGEKTTIKQENDVKSLYCTNSECAAKHIKLFAHFAGRDAMNIEGMSEATVERLTEEGMLHEPADIFRLEKYRDRIVGLEGFGEKSYEKLIASVDRARKTVPARLIYSLGILNIGLSNAKLICRAFDNDIESVRHATVEDLSSIQGVGPVIAETFVEYFKSEKHNMELDNLLEEITFEKQEKTGMRLAGQVFVITGSIEHFSNRNELKEVIEQNGGKVAASVTGKTDYLINNDNTSASTKNKKAKELGIRIITEGEFLSMIS